MDSITRKYQKHIASAFDIGCNLFDVLLKEFDNADDMFCSHCPIGCDFKSTHLYGCFEAERWDNKYIYYCPCGFIFIAVPIFDERNVLNSGIVTGPIIMGAIEDFDETYGLPNLSTSKVNDIAELISAVFKPVAPTKHRDIDTTGLLNTIYKELEIMPDGNYYPMELEKELQKAITSGDGKRAREMLNKYLGQIFFYSNGDLKIIKARTLELIILLSRSAIEGGADAAQVLNLNNNYIAEVESFESLEKLSVWLSVVINRFISYVFEFGAVKHSDTIFKVTAYIKNNYMKKLTLDEIADSVFLSKTYLSRIFNEEMNMTISSYINKIRIEKSKILLNDNSLTIADIATLVGYEDQSYYTKMFKKAEGISPGAYREKH